MKRLFCIMSDYANVLQRLRTRRNSIKAEDSISGTCILLQNQCILQTGHHSEYDNRHLESIARCISGSDFCKYEVNI